MAIYLCSRQRSRRCCERGANHRGDDQGVAGYIEQDNVRSEDENANVGQKNGRIGHESHRTALASEEDDNKGVTGQQDGKERARKSGLDKEH